ncbi:hypothetical protein C8E05_0108 [Rhodococcus wratislaviensis]|uniref:Polyketide cyclase/dehydrase/lipid transport protein n=2 Tax=Rhodococcus wratislaviensis TaxID=44752 RepID=A0AB38F613_RHOWR|nr:MULTISPECIES: hypothetical protein [Rhodococcus]REE70783.1 hypothetical protein C8E05_0108 [Rhodococcus wratislaviensis]WAM14851.1 hypothetical protein OYT95_36685 [Rhodococcus sp. JS3073]GAF45362.1 hypothetical protein RW1_019_01150 [Rhodococcus wratislaviensis NBRC 100605]SPZ34794.1 Uncharacterised protein [Rhodococcus wratislaviensis]
MTDIVTVDENGRYRLHLERRLHHDCDEVWRVLRLLHPECGDTGMACRARPPSLLEYACGESVLRWDITGDGHSRSVLRFSHQCPRRQDGIEEMGWWLTELDVLGELLDGVEVTDFQRRAEDMIDRCRRAFE